MTSPPLPICADSAYSQIPDGRGFAEIGHGGRFEPPLKRVRPVGSAVPTGRGCRFQEPTG